MIELQPFNQIKQINIYGLDGLSEKGNKNIFKLLRYNVNEPKKPRQKVLKNEYLYIHPQSKFCILYNIFYLVFFYMIQVHLTLTITFGFDFLQNDLSNQIFAIYYWSMVSFFVLDIFINFNKGFYDEQIGIYVDNYFKMFKKYCHFQLWIDVICVIFMTVAYLTNLQRGQIIMFVPVLLMWIKKSKIQQEILNVIQYDKIKRTLFTLTVLACDFLIVGHYGACIFLKIDLELKDVNYFGNNKKYIWFQTNDPFKFTDYQEHWYILYLYSQVFSTGTLSTIAPGPFPKNPISVVFSIFFTFFSIMLTSYLAEILMEIIEYNQKKKTFYEQNIQVFGRYLRAKDIKLKLQIEVYNYFQVLKEFQDDNQNYLKNKGFNLLPQTLKKQLSLQISFLSRLTFIESFNQPQNLIYELSKNIKTKFLTAETYFFQQIQLQNIQSENFFPKCQSLNFLVSGILSYQIADYNHKNKFQQSILNFSNTDKFIGFYQFITQRTLRFHYKTKRLCVVNLIARQDFEKALKFTKNDEKFQKLKYQVLIENKINLINKVCLVCLSESHVESNCPQLFVSQKFKREIKIQKQNQQFQQRIDYIRKDFNKLKALKFSKTQSFKLKNLGTIIKNYQKNYHKNEGHKEFIIQVIKDFQSYQNWQDFYPKFNFK